MNNKILFISKSQYKRQEIKRLFETHDIEIDTQDYGYVSKLEELQKENIEDLVKEKVKSIYKQVKRPIIVEHTALKINELKGQPNNFTQYFWKSIGNDGICNLVKDDRIAIAETAIAYCDGKRIYVSIGKTNGSIAIEPRGNSKFSWDPIFIPFGQDKTFAELEEEKQKDKYSMRKKAVDDIVEVIKNSKSTSDKYLTVGLDKEIIQEILERITEEKLILFIGAGVSANVGIPTWNELINTLSKELGYDSEVFNLLGDNLELAEYYSLIKDKNLNIVRDHFEGIENEEDIKNNDIYKYLTKLNVKTIYTTNYEKVLEIAFKHKYGEDKVDSIYDLKTLESSDENKYRIIKFHGDIDKIEDIVLTQSSYYDRYDFEKIMDILLRSDILTKSILFLGYGFGDNNLKYMLYKLNKLRNKYTTDQEALPTSYIFLTENNPIQRRILRENYSIKSIVSDNLNKGQALEEFLKELSEGLSK